MIFRVYIQTPTGEGVTDRRAPEATSQLHPRYILARRPYLLQQVRAASLGRARPRLSREAAPVQQIMPGKRQRRQACLSEKASRRRRCQILLHIPGTSQRLLPTGGRG